MNAQRAFAIVTGGGTSGHVLPALAVADGLVAAGHPPSTIHYVGTERGVEARLVPPTGYPFTLLDVVGLQRSFELDNPDVGGYLQPGVLLLIALAALAPLLVHARIAASPRSKGPHCPMPSSPVRPCARSWPA